LIRGVRGLGWALFAFATGCGAVRDHGNWESGLLYVVLIAVVLCVGFDARRKRSAHGAAILRLQARTAAHAQQLETLGHAVARLVPPDARPTEPRAAALVDRGRDRFPPPPLVPRGLPSFGPDDAPLTPQRSAEAVERQIAEMAGAPAEPIVTEGDRPGVNPGDVPDLGRAHLDLLRLGGEQVDAQEIRERLQRAADEQGGAAPGDDDEPTDVCARIGALSGRRLERPTSSATRTAAAFEATHGKPSSRTAVKPGEPTASD